MLIHSNVMDHTIYDNVVPLLKKEYNIIRYDLRVFGSSDLGREELSLDLYIEDLKQLIDSLNLQSVHFVGFGFGSLIALKFSTLYEKTVKKLVLMTMPCFPETAYDSVKTHRNENSQYGKIVPVDTIITKATNLRKDDREYDRNYQMINAVSPSIYKKIMELTLFTNPIPLMKKTAKSSLILAGEREIIFPQTLLTSVASYLPNFHYTVVPNASSFLMIDQPALVAHLMLEFLQSEKEERYTEDDIANDIYELVRLYTENVFKFGETIDSIENEVRVDFLTDFYVEINNMPI